MNDNKNEEQIKKEILEKIMQISESLSQAEAKVKENG